jgi:hypothetical protein
MSGIGVAVFCSYGSHYSRLSQQPFLFLGQRMTGNPSMMPFPAKCGYLGALSICLYNTSYSLVDYLLVEKFGVGRMVSFLSWIEERYKHSKQ